MKPTGLSQRIDIRESICGKYFIIYCTENDDHMWLAGGWHDLARRKTLEGAKKLCAEYKDNISQGLQPTGEPWPPLLL